MMGSEKFSELISEFTGELKAGPDPSYRDGAEIEVCWDSNRKSKSRVCNQHCSESHGSGSICLICKNTYQSHNSHLCKDGKRGKFETNQGKHSDEIEFSDPGPDVTTFRIFNPKHDSCVVDSVSNSVLKCEMRCFHPGQKVWFSGSTPPPLKAQTEYFIHQCDSSGNFTVRCSAEGDQALSIDTPRLAFSVFWNVQIQDVTVKAESNGALVFTSAGLHHLKADDPLRFSTAVGLIPAYANHLQNRAFVKRVITPNSFTVAMALDQWDKAGDEVRGDIKSDLRIGPIEVDDPPECTWKRCTITSIENDQIPDGHPQQSFTVVFQDGTTVKKVHISCTRIVERGVEAPGGVIFIDETYDLMPNENQTGKSILNLIMDAAEKHKNKVSFIIAGYKNRIERDLYSANPGMSGRFIPIEFSDYSDEELESMWMSKCNKDKITCSLKVAKIATLRVARKRGVWDFSNARAIEALFQLSTRRFKSLLSGPFELTSEDIVGKEPSLLNNSELRSIFQDLEKLIGLKKASGATKANIYATDFFFTGQRSFPSNS